MNRIKTMTLTAGAAMLIFASCSVNDPIYETAHPNYGTITLTTDWSGMGAEITKPASYTIEVAGVKITADKDSYAIPNKFEAGTYAGSAYATSAATRAGETITVSGTVATVGTVVTPSGATGIFVEAKPDWLFTAHNPNVIIQKDTHHEFTATMQQQVRELTLVLKPEGGTTDKIAGITATLSGVAASWDFAANAPSGAAATVTPIFTKQPDGTYQATVRLLGVMGAKQELTAVFSFTGGNPQNLTITSDLTSPLTSFNADKKSPLALGATVVETPTEAGFTCTINGWTVEPDRPGIAN